MLPTNYKRLHPAPGAAGQDVIDDAVAHAVGVTIDRLDSAADEDLVMIDPWPGVLGGARDRGAVPAAIEAAHRDRSFHALVYYWVGWS
jgi:hypothetical protein